MLGTNFGFVLLPIGGLKVLALLLVDCGDGCCFLGLFVDEEDDDVLKGAFFLIGVFETEADDVDDAVDCFFFAAGVPDVVGIDTLGLDLVVGVFGGTFDDVVGLLAFLVVPFCGVFVVDALFDDELKVVEGFLGVVDIFLEVPAAVLVVPELHPPPFIPPFPASLRFFSNFVSYFSLCSPSERISYAALSCNNNSDNTRQT